MAITQAGYQVRTLEEWRNLLLTEAKLSVQGFSEQPAEIQNNLISESAVIMKLAEQFVQENINNMLPITQNQASFIAYGESLGLTYHNKTRSQVTLVFEGVAGTYIPQSFAVQNGDGSITVTTLSDGVINSVGECVLLAECTQDGSVVIEPDTMNELTEIIAGVTVNNPNAGTQGLSSETFQQYRKRVWKTTTLQAYGAFDNLYSQIANVSGVDIRLFNAVEVLKTEASKPPYMYTEIVVGGGDDVEVALAIDKGAGLTGLLYSSNPSGGETNRTINVALQVFGSTRNITYTRPKQSVLRINITTTSTQTVDSSLPVQLTREIVQNYINNLTVGSDIGLANIQNLILQALTTIVDINNIGAFTWTIILDGINISTASISTGFIKLEYDQYCVLTDYGLTVQNIGV